MAKKRKVQPIQQEEPQAVDILPPRTHPREGKESWNTHPPEVVAAIVEELLAGKTLTQIHQETGISLWFLRRIWAQYGEIVDQVRNRQIVERLEDKIEKLVELVDDPQRLENVNLRDLGIVLGILLDKRKDLVSRPQGQRKNVALKIAWKSADGQEFDMETIALDRQDA